MLLPSTEPSILSAVWKRIQLIVFGKPVAESLPDGANGADSSVRKVQKTSAWHTKPVTRGKSPWNCVVLRRGHWTHSVGSSWYPKVQFPIISPSCRKMTDVKAFCSFWSMCAFVMLSEKNIFRHFKGEMRKWMQRNKMVLQTRAGNQIITLTSNFGIKYFGNTILSLWFWLFSTKHPVLKGRLVVGLFISFFYLSFDKTVHHLPAHIWEREKNDSKKERGGLQFLAFFLFNYME